MNAATQHELSVLTRGKESPLARAHAVGMVTSAEVQLATILTRLHGCADELVQLTAALCFAIGRAGSTCLDLTTAAEQFIDQVLESQDLTADELAAERQALQSAIDWPDPVAWREHLVQQRMLGDEGAEPNSVPMRLVDSLVYLERYWSAEEQVAGLLHERELLSPPAVNEHLLDASLARLPEGTIDDSRQRNGVETAVRSWTSVLAGGPGTGKTSTVVRVLAAVQEQAGATVRVALAAPSGKAASRLYQSVAGQAPQLEAAGALMPAFGAGMTLHRLLGARGRTGEFRHGPTDQLPYDLVVVDEVSMVDLQLFATLLSAVGPSTRLLLVGDPQQLKSISAGSVLADITSSGLTVGGGDPASAVTELVGSYRSEGAIQHLAAAIRAKDADAALDVLAGDSGEVELIDLEITRATTWQDLPQLSSVVAQQWTSLVRAAEAGDATEALRLLDEHRVLCAHRDGLFGVSSWTHHTLDLVRQLRPGFGVGAEFWVGRPLLLTENDATLGLSNGDTGVVVWHDDRLQVALGDEATLRLLSPNLLRGVENLFAMTVHKAQGSQFGHTTVVLPPLGSPLLTHELIYTAVTRAKRRVSIIGSADQLRTAIATESRRASGLASRWRRQNG
ncbi:exodeoxyribonuclease V subunit alpha [Propionibacteriaceae bacterium G1746]